MNTILTTIAVVLIINLVLTLILSIADRTIGDYGEVKMVINDEKEYIVAGGDSLLNTLRNEKIFIPSACGGKGSCGYCKVKGLEGLGPILATEKPQLTKEEMENNVRLSCQVKVKQDIKIEIPEELFNVREYTTSLVEKKPLTDRITLFRFQLPEGEVLNFKPGQYVQLKAPAYPAGDGYEGSDDEVYRAYSIASSVKDEGFLELIIGFTGGLCTTYCHKVLQVGDQVDINGPYGDFYYIEDETEIVMGAGGTGFAPIRSILYHMLDQGIERKARFYFGARTPDDLFLLDEIAMFEEKLHDFKFMPTLSRATEEMGWTGDTGYTDVSIRKYLDENIDYTAYLCGSPRMIDTFVGALKEKGLDDDHILFDDFS